VMHAGHRRRGLLGRAVGLREGRAAGDNKRAAQKETTKRFPHGDSSYYIY
jgi:hypothetical protein